VSDESPLERSASEPLVPAQNSLWSADDAALESRKEREGTQANSLLENGVVREALGEDLAQCLRSTFEQITVAEELLSEAKQQHPESAALLDRQFVKLRWWIPEAVRDVVYRDHVRELLLRVVKGESLQPGTRAEVLTLLCSVAKRNGLSRQTGALFGWLFGQVAQMRLPAAQRMAEKQTDAERDQLLAELRQQLVADWRELRPLSDETA
jgi:hypothetical protein